MLSTIISLAALSVTLFGALVTVCVYFGRESERLRYTQEKLKEQLAQVSSVLDRLNIVAVLEQRIGMVEGMQARTVSHIDELREKVALLRGEASGRWASLRGDEE